MIIRRLLPRHMDRNGWEQCVPGGEISVITERDEIQGASRSIRRVYDLLATLGGILINIEVFQEETPRP